MAKAANDQPEKSILEKLKDLDAERERLLNEAKANALAMAEQAIEELNQLGFHYRLMEGDKPRPRAVSTVSASSGTRRTGIRDDVMKVIVEAGPDGVAPAAIRDKLGMSGKSDAQAVANALSALKKANKIADKDGSYVAA